MIVQIARALLARHQSFQYEIVLSPQAAELLNLATAGLKRGASNSTNFEKRVKKLAAIFVAGLRYRGDPTKTSL